MVLGIGMNVCATTWPPAPCWTNAHCELVMKISMLSRGCQLGRFSTQQQTFSCLRTRAAVQPRTTLDPRSMESCIYPPKRACLSLPVRQLGLNGGAQVMPTVYRRLPQGHADLSRSLMAEASCRRLMRCNGAKRRVKLYCYLYLLGQIRTDTIARRRYNQQTFLEG